MKEKNLGGSVPHFIELRRKSKKITQHGLCKRLGLSLKTYRAKVKEERLTLAELKLIGSLLDYNIQLVPREADIITA